MIWNTTVLLSPTWMASKVWDRLEEHMNARSVGSEPCSVAAGVHVSEASCNKCHHFLQSFELGSHFLPPWLTHQRSPQHANVHLLITYCKTGCYEEKIRKTRTSEEKALSPSPRYSSVAKYTRHVTFHTGSRCLLLTRVHLWNQRLSSQKRASSDQLFLV